MQGSALFRILVLVVCVGASLPQDATTRSRKPMTSPPSITRQAANEVAFKKDEREELVCEATGDPAPTYRWEKDGQPLAITGVAIQMEGGSGTLVFKSPKDDHEGTYQCLASNEFGTALAVKTVFKAAMQDSFHTKDPVNHYPDIGAQLTLNCEPPASYPTAMIFWGESKSGEDDSQTSDDDDNANADDLFQKIPLSERVAIDYQGNLRFSNVEHDDMRNGQTYVCIVWNHVLRTLVQGSDQRITVEDWPATPPYQSPKLMWKSAADTVTILKGDRAKLKCIFSGQPTPTVSWERMNNRNNRPMPARATQEDFGRELKIKDIDYEDEGRYACVARQGESGVPVREIFNVVVESMPEWEEKPQNVLSSEEENATFSCAATGRPKPNITWTVNGKQLSEQPNLRRSVSGNKLIYRNLTKTDAQVIQCYARNVHGSIFHNAFLNVQAEPPFIMSKPVSVVKIAERQVANLTCRALGAPAPVITWYFGNQRVPLQGPRYKVTPEGDLEITGIQPDDQGTYTCEANNKFGKDKASGQLTVRKPTTINLAPQSKTVNVSTNVEFRCEAETDPEERRNLVIKWLKNGQPIDYEREGLISMNMATNSLHIHAAQVRDSQKYTCVATNGIDTDSITVDLLVRDRPGVPYFLKLMQCGTAFARIQWTPGPDNNAEIERFAVSYNTSFDRNGEHHEAVSVGPEKNDAQIEISPWVNYTFSVRAKNMLGWSERSAYSLVCKTQQARPDRHPDGVCTESREPDQLVIVWNHMPEIEHNGEDFHYIVGYRPADGLTHEFIETRINEWNIDYYIVPNQQTFHQYEIYVKAVNKMGSQRDNMLDKRYGYSGEDEPLETPSNFSVDEDSLNGTSAKFYWNPVDKSASRMRGHFKGYQIQYWREDQPDDMRITDILSENFQPCPVVRRPGGPSRVTRQARESGHVNNLWPYSSVQAGVLAMNSGKMGKLSHVIAFNTPEGVPSRAIDFRVTERGSHHLRVRWSPPLFANGILVGFTVGYRRVSKQSEPMREFDVNDPQALRDTLRDNKLNIWEFKIRDLDEETDYILYVWGRTSVGKGEEERLEDRTIRAGVPDSPIIADVYPGDSHIMVEWIPSNPEDHELDRNPGSEFYIEYRPAGSEGGWESTDLEDQHNRANITGLDNGERYEIRVVAVNAHGEKSHSESKTVQVGAMNAPVVSVAKAGWFIAMMIIIVFLLLIIIIICLIKRNRGGKYPVHEKEKLRGRDPEKDDEDDRFGEYLRTDEPDPKKRSHASLNSEQKPLESDTDSMAEYDQMDPSKFNEDGSFIGQYGGPNDVKKTAEPNATSPSALSTLV